MRRILRLATLAAMAGCAPVANGEDETRVADLLTSVQATELGDSVRFVLQVTNTTGSEIDLTYPSGQSFDFVVSDASGAEVWRWSADQMFTQAVREEEIPAGETITYSAIWPAAGYPRGEYVVRGALTLLERTVEQRTAFTLR